MKKRLETNDIIARHSDRPVPPEGPAASLNATLLEMTHEHRRYARHTKQMIELKRMASLQERVIHRILDRNIEKLARPERPQLKLVK